VLDPLYSKAIVIESGGERIALVVLDLISIRRAITDDARAAIEKTIGIKAGKIMISATHAHTGPELTDPGQAASGSTEQKRLVIDYSEALPDRIAESVRLAHERLQRAQLAVAEGRCEDLTFNRRFFMRDGSVGWNPGKRNPDIVMPAGPSDPEVKLLYIERLGADGPTQSIATYGHLRWQQNQRRLAGRSWPRPRWLSWNQPRYVGRERNLRQSEPHRHLLGLAAGHGNRAAPHFDDSWSVRVPGL
jgi:hypothetical protein